MFYKVFCLLTCPRGFNFSTSSPLCSFLENSIFLLGHSQSPFSASTIIAFQQGADPEPQ